MERVSVVGNSGSGKTTLARQIAAAIDAPHLELDGVFHQPGWEPLDTESFQAEVGPFVAGPRWVVDGNYRVVRDLIWERADTVVFFDLPRRVVMRRLIRRTLRRTITKEPLWNGNTEALHNLWQRDPWENIVLWAWTNHRRYAERYRELAGDPRWSELRFVQIASPKDAEALLAALRTGGSS